MTSAGHADSYVSSAQKPGAASPLESTIYLVRRDAKGVRVAGRSTGSGCAATTPRPWPSRTSWWTGRPDQPAGGGREDDARGGAALVQHRHRGDGERPVPAVVAQTSGHLQEAGFEHTGQKLRDLPNLRARLAEMAVRTEQARTLLGLHARRDGAALGDDAAVRPPERGWPPSRPRPTSPTWR